MSEGPPQLVLHVDINKTLIISDPASSAPFEQMVNAVICELAWGTADAISDPDAPIEEKLKLWHPVSEELSADSCVGGAMTYEHFLERYLDLPRLEKKKYKHLFTEPSQPGERYRRFYDQILDKLRLPVDQASALRTLQPGYHYILPSFYKLLMHLESSGRDFRIVFRTFGHDLSTVAYELNAFCEGRHPCYPGVHYDGSDSRSDFRIKLPHQSARIIRASGLTDEVCISYIDDEQLMTVAQGWQGLAKAMDVLLTRSHVAGVQDDYSYWHAHGEADDSGKPMLIDRLDAGRVHIFFDDNIEHDRAHAVNVRDAQSGEALPFSETKERHLWRVNPYLAIMDDDYFINCVRECEEAVLARSH